MPSTRRVVTVSLAVDVVDIVTNLVVAAVTGSAVVFAEMAQGVADGIGSLLLVIGERRSRLPRDERYPSGHGREVFFWALLAAIVMITVGSGLSFWRGHEQLVMPQPLRHPWLALAVLLLSVATNGHAARLGYLRLRRPGTPFRQAWRESSQPLVKAALLQDGLGTLSAVTGLASLVLYSLLDSATVFDGLGAIAIGAIMVALALSLIVRVHHLIAGCPVPDALQSAIRAAVLSVPEVEAINAMSATFFGSEDIVVDLDLDLREQLSTEQIEEALDAIHAAISREEPAIHRLRVDLNSPQVAGQRARKVWT